GRTSLPRGPLRLLRRLESYRPVLALGQDPAVVEGPREERLHPVEMVLLPVAHQRMVVTLSAGDVDPEEDDARVDRHAVNVGNARAQEVARAFSLGVAFVRQEQLAEDLV